MANDETNAAFEKARRILDRIAGALLVCAIAAAASLALSPGLFAQRIPYGEGDLGNVATGTLKAHRDYDVPDDETTRRKRDEAVEAVRAVYDHDAGALDQAVQRLRLGFGAARSSLANAAPGDAAERQLRLEKAREEIEQALGARLDDAEFAALARAGFPSAVEEAAVALVTTAMREMIVGDREELALHRDRGIAIHRHTAAGKAIEESLSDVSGLRDLARVRAAIDAAAPELASLPAELRDPVASLARREVRVNLKADPELTRQRREEAAAAVKPVVIQLKKGEKIIGDGERIAERHLVIFRALKAQAQAGDLAQIRIGAALLATLLLLSLLGYGSAGLPRFAPKRRDLVFLASTVAALLLFADLWLAVADVLRERAPEIPGEAWTWAMPLAAGAMLVRFVVGAEAGLLFAALIACLVGVLTGNSLGAAVFFLAGGVAGGARMGKVRDRNAIFRAGALAALAQAGVVVAFALFAGRIASWDVLLGVLAAALGGGVFGPVLVMSLLPLVEKLFGYTTDLRLLELANLNHPALKELIVQAPGTYHHSIIVGTLVEGAAEAIGANPLLAKVCAYYHDLGKGRNPLYFGENQKGGNRHDELPPEESARLIIEHVARGLEIARKYKLPRAVSDGIPEHHGTRLVGYFYHKALKAREGREDVPPVDPDRFRYAGPKPQSRETALIMMADAVEAASRAMPDPTAEKLRALVQKLIHGIFVDGQLDECELTVRDLAKITDSFCMTLRGIYHTRPEYPAAAKGPQSEMAARVASSKVG